MTPADTIPGELLTGGVLLACFAAAAVVCRVRDAARARRQRRRRVRVEQRSHVRIIHGGDGGE